MNATTHERSITASDYIKENFESRDRIALLILNRETGESVQRITTAEKACSPEFVRTELEKIKPDMFMLAEAHKPELLVKAFDLDYSWPLHSALTNVLQGRGRASELREEWDKETRRLRQRRKQTILQRRYLKPAACFLKQRHMNLVQAPDQKPRSLGQGPRAALGVVATFLGSPQRPSPDASELVMTQICERSSLRHRRG